MFSQEDIGYDLGLIVPKKYKKILPNARTGGRPPAGWGTQIGKKEYSLNRFFKKRKLPLKETYYPLSKIDDAKEWIKDQIKRESDIIVCFNYGKLYGGEGFGHVSILDSIKNDAVTLIDPERNVPKYRKVKLKQLLNAIEFHGEKNRSGFWLVSYN
jgi:hypothetical protein